jgi:hypothetical protein
MGLRLLNLQLLLIFVLKEEYNLRKNAIAIETLLLLLIMYKIN